MIDNDQFGCFIISKNIVSGVPIKYSYRETSEIKNLNGWTLYSAIDEYVSDSKNFIILIAESIYRIAPVMLEIFSANYETDLYWIYKDNVHVGFYDLKLDKEVTY